MDFEVMFFMVRLLGAKKGCLGGRWIWSCLGEEVGEARPPRAQVSRHAISFNNRSKPDHANKMTHRLRSEMKL